MSHAYYTRIVLGCVAGEEEGLGEEEGPLQAEHALCGGRRVPPS